MSDAKLILDTDVASFLMKGGPLAKAYAPHVQGRLVAICFVTVGEMYFGAENANWGERKRKDIETHLRNFVVIPYDHEIARCYGRLMAECMRNGRSIAPNDAWVAACALRHTVPLVTHNARHFEKVPGLRVVTERPPELPARPAFTSP